MPNHILLVLVTTKDPLHIAKFDVDQCHTNDKYDNILDLKSTHAYAQSINQWIVIPGKYPSASYSHVKFESTLIGACVVVVFFFARQANAASVANKVTVSSQVRKFIILDLLND